ncbi:MAG: hypothetical protein Q7S71_01000 [Candidatus Nitrotoga sp.]|nr:hypothetical protein [Candidatus Nitrotoga sp.]
MSYLDAKPTDSKESLLNDIMAAANQSHMPGLPLRPFAALVVKVADETAETVSDLKAHITNLNQQNARLQWWVVALAIAALIGTVVQTAAALYALAAPSPSVAVGPATQPQPLQLVSEPTVRTAVPPTTAVSVPASAPIAGLPSGGASASQK